MLLEWISRLYDTFKPYIVELVVGALLLIWIYDYILYFIVRLRPIAASLQAFNDYLAKVENGRRDNDFIINGYFDESSNTPLNKVWKDYYTNKAFNPDLSHYFNMTRLIDMPALRNRAAQVPAFLTTIGLLGSFLTLIAKLSDAQAPLSDLNFLSTVIIQVLFLAVFTMIISAFYLHLDKKFYGSTQSLVYELQQQLNMKLAARVDTDQSDRIAASIDAMSKSFALYAENTSDMQVEGLNKMVDAFLNKLKFDLNGEITALGRTLDNFTVSQEKAAGHIQHLTNALIKGTSNQYDINKSSETIINSIAEYHEQVTNNNKALADSLNHVQELTEALNGILVFNTQALEGVKHERETLTNEYTKYMEGLQIQIQKYQKDSSIELERVMARFADVSGKTFDRLETSIMKSMDVWTNSNKSMLQNMEDQSRSLVSVSREIAIRLNELGAGLEKTVKEFTKTVDGGTTRTLTQFDEGLGEITDRLSRTIVEIRDSIDELPAVIESLKRIR